MNQKSCGVAAYDVTAYVCARFSRMNQKYPETTNVFLANQESTTNGTETAKLLARVSMWQLESSVARQPGEPSR
jgi:hypothetical protein